MQNIPDNQLDNFFKEALENPGLAFNPKAWNSMEKKLDKTLIRMLWVNRIKYLSLFLLAVSLLTLTWYEIGNAEQNRIAKNNKIGDRTAQQKINIEQSKEYALTQSSEDNKKEIRSKPDQPANKSLNFQSKKNNLSDLHLRYDSQKHDVKYSKLNSNESSERHLIPNNQKELLSHTISDGENKKTLESTKSSISRTINKSVDFHPIKKLNNSFAKKSFYENGKNYSDLENYSERNFDSGKETVSAVFPALNNIVNDQEQSKGIDDKQAVTNSLKDAITGDRINQLEKSITIEEDQYNINNLQSLDAFYFVSTMNPIQLSFNKRNQEESTSKHIIKKKADTRPLIRLSGLISPDFSSYLEAKMLKSGYNTGFSLEIFPMKRFSVSGGILKSKKVYSATPGEYKPYEGFWEGKTLPKNIEGECKITDLQLNLRYYVVSASKIQVFAGTGMSSYLMRHEIYTYDYTTWEKTIHISKKNNHYFSIINLSAGLEHRLGNRLAFGIEPFIKVPVTGIGAGKIKLNSGGVFLSLTYILLNK